MRHEHGRRAHTLSREAVHERQTEGKSLVRDAASAYLPRGGVERFLARVWSEVADVLEGEADGVEGGYTQGVAV